MYHIDVSGTKLSCRLGVGARLGAPVRLREATATQLEAVLYSRIQPTNGDLIRSEDGAGGQSMGSGLNYLDAQYSRQPRQIHSRTHIQTHTPCLEFFPVCLTASLSTFLHLPAFLKLSASFRFYLPSPFSILIFSSFFSKITVSSVRVVTNSFSFQL